MIVNDEELKTTLDRIDLFRRQVAELRQKETDAESYRLAVSGYLAEIDRMNLEVSAFWSRPPAEQKPTSR